MLIEPEVPIPYVYFVRDGVCSMIATEQEGGEIEVGAVGCDGFVGFPLALGEDTMSNRVIVQIEGDAWRLSADAFRDVVDERPAVRTPCLRYTAYFTGQLSQAVACNELHTLEERAITRAALDRLFGSDASRR